MRKILIVSFVVVFGCGKAVEQSPRVELNGINGPAKYIFGDDGKPTFVYKDEYYGPEFVVMLKRDTLILGEDFIGHVTVPHDGYSVQIEHPLSYVITDDGTPGLREFRYHPETEGEFEFAGVVKYDTVSVSFEYKFVVLAAEN